jgi:hypothetical protein
MQKAKILDKFSAHDQNRMNDAIALILGRKIN